MEHSNMEHSNMKHKISSDAPYLSIAAYIYGIPYEPGHADKMLLQAVDEEERRQIL